MTAAGHDETPIGELAAPDGESAMPDGAGHSSDSSLHQQAAPARSRPAASPVFGRWGTRGTAVVLALAAIAVLIVGSLVGYAIRGSANRTQSSAVSAVPTIDSVDAGFARDMITHHQQGVLMANYEEADSQDADVRLMAYDINATQLAQVGEMQGWLSLWQLPQQVPGPRMAWMTGSGAMARMQMTTSSGTSASVSATGTAEDSQHQAVMPGMATTGEMDRLKSLRGKESDVYFLQLMIRHHEGGEAMMLYAEKYAGNPIVANFAAKMIESQTNEVSVMTQMLAERGAKPLPFTPPA
ncbi:MAG: DUF305 domain-containing protein [Actinomycetota bacterium]|nr:DUF305 domain-containing protein [Actinomycetota bacterium]